MYEVLICSWFCWLIFMYIVGSFIQKEHIFQRAWFLVVFISFYTSRYHFSQILRIWFNSIWKMDFSHGFSFFNGFTQSPSPLPPPDFTISTFLKSYFLLIANILRISLSLLGIYSWYSFVVMMIFRLCIDLFQ